GLGGKYLPFRSLNCVIRISVGNPGGKAAGSSRRKPPWPSRGGLPTDISGYFPTRKKGTFTTAGLPIPGIRTGARYSALVSSTSCATLFGVGLPFISFTLWFSLLGSSTTHLLSASDWAF